MQLESCAVAHLLQPEALSASQGASPLAPRPAWALLYRWAHRREEGTPVSSLRHLDDDLLIARAPSPGIAAVLSILIPGLGQVYAGRLAAGAAWFLVTSFCYWAVLLPGFIAHALCVWSAYQGAKDWRSY